MLGYSPEELMSLGLVNIISEDAKNIIQKVLLEELENEINRNADPHRSRIIETEQLRKDGSKIWVEGTVSFYEMIMGTLLEFWRFREMYQVEN